MSESGKRYYVLKEDGGGGWCPSWQIADRIKEGTEGLVIATVWTSRKDAVRIARLMNEGEKQGVTIAQKGEGTTPVSYSKPEFFFACGYCGGSVQCGEKCLECGRVAAKAVELQKGEIIGGREGVSKRGENG